MKEKINPKPQLFQWYRHEGKVNKKIRKSWNIFLVQRGNVLWGFNVDDKGNVEIGHTNIRYWNDEKHEFPDTSFLEKNKPFILENERRLMIKIMLNEHYDSEWFYY